jgi:hypothetical protein
MIPSKDPRAWIGQSIYLPIHKPRRTRRTGSRQEQDCLKRSPNPWIGQSIYLPIMRQTRGRQEQDSLNDLPIRKRQTRGSTRRSRIPSKDPQSPGLGNPSIGPCSLPMQTKIFPFPPITLNLSTHAWSIKYR